MTQPGDGLLYLSRADVAAALPPPLDLIAAVERAFAAYGSGTARIGDKARVPVRLGHFFQTMLGRLEAPPIAGMKWFGVVPENPARGLPNVSGIIVLSDVETAQPVAVLDGNVITGARTAAMSAVAARRLAAPDAATIAFIGCGTQAKSHALYLRAVRPDLRRAVVFGRSVAGRDTFAGELQDAGWIVETATDPNKAVAAADIAVTTVPECSGFAAFLDPARLRPGGLAVGVDLGRSWLPSGLGHFATVVTDDAAQSAHLVEEGRLNAPATFDADLAALATGAAITHAADKRAFFVFAGHVLGDLAAAAAVYQRARDGGIGIRLPL